MNKNELIAEVADKAGLTKAKAAECLDAFIEIVSKSMSKGDEVRLVGFGTFTTVHRKATEGRNPRTGAVIKIAAANKPKFKPGKQLAELVNRNSSKRKAA
jgi:DNA-binding protein HU-beta